MKKTVWRSKMNIELLARRPVGTDGIRYSIANGGIEFARAYLYIMRNDLHEKPFGLLEDVFVDENFRGRGIGSEFVGQIIQKARDLGCYKIICTSRYGRDEVHAMYEKIGFENRGLEFRIDLESKEVDIPGQKLN